MVHMLLVYVLCVIERLMDWMVGLDGQWMRWSVGSMRLVFCVVTGVELADVVGYAVVVVVVVVTAETVAAVVVVAVTVVAPVVVFAVVVAVVVVTVVAVIPHCGCHRCRIR